jgi:hypothetical protein
MQVKKFVPTLPDKTGELVIPEPTPSAEVIPAKDTKPADPAENNLAVCPKELKTVDPNAETLWPLFLRRTGVTVSRGEHIEDRRAWIVRNFGVPSLTQRLSPHMTERERARVWWRECAACSKGDTIPDLNLHNLNPWIVTDSEKYPDPRAARLEKARQAKREREPAPDANRCAQCNLVLPDRHRGKYCDRACQQAAYRTRHPVTVANTENTVT